MENDQPSEATQPVRQQERIIQPLHTSPTKEQLTPISTVRPAIDPAEIYPEATRDASIEAQHREPDNYWDRQNVSDKTIASQVKTLMALVVIGFISELFLVAVIVINYSTLKNSPGIGIVYGTLFINFLVYLFLLLSKNNNSVAMVLKVLLVLELISVFGIFFGVGSVVSISGLLNLLLTFIALNQVRNLHR